MGRRRRGREYALQMLFQADMSGDRPPAMFEAFWEGQEASEEVRALAEQLVLGTVSERERLDAAIAHVAKNWRLERMAAVDRNVLRMASYEMLFLPETPSAVVIDEAIEIVRKFGSEESARFINGILDGVRKAAEGGRLAGAPTRVGPDHSENGSR